MGGAIVYEARLVISEQKWKTAYGGSRRQKILLQLMLDCSYKLESRAQYQTIFSYSFIPYFMLFLFFLWPQLRRLQQPPQRKM